MKITSLKCNNCGADLDIPLQVKFCNCNLCGTALNIKASGNTLYTEVLVNPEENPQLLAHQANPSSIEKEIAKLDKAWLIEREKYILRDKDGTVHLPYENANMIIIFAAIFIFTAIAIFSYFSYSGTINQSNIFMAVSILVAYLALITWKAYHEFNITQRHNFEKQQYAKKRASLLSQLNLKQEAEVA